MRFAVISEYDEHGVSFGPFENVAEVKTFIRKIGSSPTGGPYLIVKAGDERDPNPRIFNYVEDSA